MSDRGCPAPYTLHGHGYYLNDRDTRPQLYIAKDHVRLHVQRVFRRQRQQGNLCPRL